MDEKLIAEAVKVLEEIQGKQAAFYPLLQKAARVQTKIEEALEKTKFREKVRVDWVMVKNAKTGRTDSLPYPMAEKMVKAGKGVIIREFEKRYENTWRVEREPPVLGDLRRLHLGDPVMIGGQYSEFFREINHRIGFECPLITAAAYQINLLEHMEGNDEKTRETEITGEKEKGTTTAKGERAGGQKRAATV